MFGVVVVVVVVVAVVFVIVGVIGVIGDGFDNVDNLFEFVIVVVVFDDDDGNGFINLLGVVDDDDDDDRGVIDILGFFKGVVDVVNALLMVEDVDLGVLKFEVSKLLFDGVFVVIVLLLLWGVIVVVVVAAEIDFLDDLFTSWVDDNVGDNPTDDVLLIIFFDKVGIVVLVVVVVDVVVFVFAVTSVELYGKDGFIFKFDFICNLDGCKSILVDGFSILISWILLFENNCFLIMLPPFIDDLGVVVDDDDEDGEEQGDLNDKLWNNLDGDGVDGASSI